MTFRGGSRPLIWVNVQVAVRRPNFKNPHIPRTFPETPAVAPAKNGLRLQECRMNPTGTTSDVNAACQFASNRDPHFASNDDPVRAASGAYPRSA